MHGHRKDMLAIAALAASALLLAPGSAHAAAAPEITSGPDIVGTPHVGAELRAQASWTGDPQPSASWRWLRCPRPVGGCTAIAGATTDRYRVTQDDLGSVLRVQLEVTSSAGSDDARSRPTLPIGPALVPTPTATPSPSQPSPTAQPTPSPQPAPAVFDTAAPASAPVTTRAPVLRPATSAPARPLRPFPVVRIKGVLTVDGARVTLLRVRAPRGVRIAVRCRGVDCPRQTFTAPSGTRRLRLFERALRAGTRLELRITKARFIGKYTSITIRRGAAPARTDRCLSRGRSRPVRCPSG